MKTVSPSLFLFTLHLLLLYNKIQLVDGEGKPESSLRFLRTRLRWFPSFRPIPTALADEDAILRTSSTTAASTSSSSRTGEIIGNDKKSLIGDDLINKHNFGNATRSNSFNTSTTTGSLIKTNHGPSLLPILSSNSIDEQQSHSKSDGAASAAAAGTISTIHNNAGDWIGGIIASLKIQNPRTIVKWGVTGLQVGILYFLGHAVWQATQDVLSELEEQTSGGSSQRGPAALKRHVVNHVLEALDRQEQDIDHIVLYRIAQRLQHVTGWQLFDVHDNADGGAKPSLQQLLFSLTRNEYSILEQCLYIPTTNEDPKAAWNKIYGIPDIQQSILDRLFAMNFCPKHNPYASILMENNAGLLLYGPPGCGKTMLLQAICATMRAPCLILTPSVLLRKYVGETNSLIRSLFQLAQKLGGCVICLDELDGLFRERRQDEHDSTRELKTEFMQWWDGLKNDPNSRILIVGATNRPFDVDPAILRRMSQSHFVGLPMAQARLGILQKILLPLPTQSDLNLSELVQSTEGFAPSDLMQIVRTASQLGPLREGRGSHSNFRPLTRQDLMVARQQVGPTPLSTEYRNALIQFHHQKQQQQHQHQPPSRQQQGDQQQSSVQATPWGNFYHAGTFSVEDLEDDESDNNTLINNEDRLEDLDDEWDGSDDPSNSNHSENDEDE